MRKDSVYNLKNIPIKKTEESLHQSMAHYKTLVEILPVGILRTDAKGNCLYFNKQWCEIAGFSPKKDVDNIWVSRLHPDDRERVFKERYRAARENLPFKSEYRFQRPDGRVIWVFSQMTAEKDNSGKITSYIETITEITEHKQTEEKLKQQQQILQLSEKNLKELSRKILSIREEEKKKLSIDLHDEIGSMVIAVSSNLSIAEKEIKDNNLQSAIKYINQTKNVLKKRIKILKDIAVDLRPPILDTIGLPNALREYFSNITKRAKTKIDFKTNLRTRKLNDNITIVLYRVTQEALNNIIQHATAKKVKVRLYLQKNNLKFNIHDDGKGFDMDNLKETKTLGTQGMRERVESIGGMFLIESAPEKGTMINITVPMAG